MAAMLECPYPTCPTLRPARFFACTPHWFSLPAPLRGKIDRTWQARRRDPTPGNVQAHMDAKREAIEWWRDQAVGRG